jgi:hypothetical protein
MKNYKFNAFLQHFGIALAKAMFVSFFSESKKSLAYQKRQLSVQAGSKTMQQKNKIPTCFFSCLFQTRGVFFFWWKKVMIDKKKNSPNGCCLFCFFRKLNISW